MDNKNRTGNKNIQMKQKRKQLVTSKNETGKTRANETKPERQWCQ